ncbi:MAG: helix-turn-helix domain-containing protein [Clostridia bacterium]|nr:helix-turn-helix domain-containing protein [Clostridia bacterium]
MYNVEQDPMYFSSRVDSFMLSLINESSYQEIAEKLGTMLRRPILIEDNFFCTLGGFLSTPIDSAFPKPQMTDPFLKEFVSKTQNQKLPLVMPPLPQYGVSQSRIVYPIVTGDVIHGYLHIFDKRNPPSLTDEENNTVMKVLMALAIKSLKDDAVIQTREKMTGHLYRKLIFREYQSERIIHETALFLNMDLSIPSWLMVAQIEGSDFNIDKLKAIKSFFVERELEAKVVFLQQGQFLIFINESKQPYKKVAITTLAHKLIEHISKCYPAITCYITLGRKCLKPGDYYKSYHEALKALDYLKESSPESQVLSFDSLGIIGLVTLPEDIEQMLAFSEKILKPLIEYEEQNPTLKLTQTLNLFLKNDCQLKKTAQELYVHVNTLRYRLEKIQEICQLDFENAEVKFELFLAFKILNLKKSLARQTP